MAQGSLPVRQIAYFVPDLVEAVGAHSRSFGSGPFFVLNHVALTRNEHRGVARPFDHSSAYGQWGSVMVELVVQHNADPSVFHDMYPRGSGRFGIHHTALIVDDLAKAIDRFAAEGVALAQHATTATGTDFAFIDATARYGHMIELYEPTPTLTGFYAMVAAAAENWDGRDPLRHLN
jgi:catechol 2,3-dioxygenase-like lactoylglutathione lyase family enzyme